MFSLFHYPQPSSLHPPSSVPCPPSLVHLSILCHFVTPSPSFTSSILHHSLIPSFCIPVSQLLASLFNSIFSTSVQYSLPPHSNFVYFTFHPLWLCESFSTSLVAYKSFWLVVYSLACNCHPLLPTQSPPSLPLVSYQSPPWQYNLLVSLLLVSSKIKDTPVPQWERNT